MIEDIIQKILKDAVAKVQPDFSDEIQLSRSQLQFGDYSSNVALILAKKLKRNPFGAGRRDKVTYKHR